VGCVNGCNRVLASFLRRSGEVEGALALLREQLEDVADRDDQECALVLIEIAEIYGEAGRFEDAAHVAVTAQALADGSGIGLNDDQRRRIAEVAAELVELRAGATPEPHAPLHPRKDQALVRAAG
jgi:hypothetical protein